MYEIIGPSLLEDGNESYLESFFFPSQSLHLVLAFPQHFILLHLAFMNILDAEGFLVIFLMEED